jgi:hypothetical protein
MPSITCAWRREKSVSITDRRPHPRSTEGKTVSALAGWGLGARATNYMLVGILVLTLAAGSRKQETDQHGALEELTQHTGGAVLVWVIACGLFAYALWRCYEAAFGVTANPDGRKAGPRALSLLRGAAYAVLGANAVHVAAGEHTGNQSHRQQQWSAEIMANTAGRWLIAALGIGLVVFGIVQTVKGIRRKFEKHLELERMSSRSRRVVRVLGVVGCSARGVVFVLVGGFVTIAAVAYDPKKAGGLDRALRELHDETAGPALLGLVGLGLIVFGLYGYCEARWRRT